MKMQKPYVPFYSGDFARSTAGWPLTTRAIYWQLLCAQWEQGPLPNNPEWLTRIAGCTEAQFTDAWPTISPKFVLTSDGRLLNERMAEHATNWERYRTQQSENGRKGGQSTQQRQREKRGGNVVDFTKKERS